MLVISINKKGDLMKKLLFAFMVFSMVSLLLAVGCAKKTESPIAPATQPVPQMEQVNPSVEKEEPIASPPVQEQPQKEEPAPIGNRVEGTEAEPVDEAIPEGTEEVLLYVNKTMSLNVMTVSAGMTVSWKNMDTFPHVLAVETGKGFDTVRHAKSPQIVSGAVWSYTFNDKGTFLVRDLFSGSMRMNVTVE